MRALIAMTLICSLAACSTRTGHTASGLGVVTDSADGGFGGPDGGFGDSGIGTPAPYPGDLGCVDTNGNPVDCDDTTPIDSGMIDDPCYDSQGNFICFGGVMPDGGYVMYQNTLDSQPRVPAQPQQAPQWFCTIDSHPTMTGWWQHWKTDDGAITVLKLHVLDYSLGSQLVQLNCSEDMKGNCNIAGGGFSSKSSCLPMPLSGYNCKCDNDFTSGETQPKGKAIAETNCTYESNKKGNAAVSFTIKNVGTANVSMDWKTTGGVESNGGTMVDACHWRKINQAFNPPNPPAN
jgi:hypothetical protein